MSFTSQAFEDGSHFSNGPSLNRLVFLVLANGLEKIPVLKSPSQAIARLSLWKEVDFVFRIILIAHISQCQSSLPPEQFPLLEE
jgi:hypothetical protein